MRFFLVRSQEGSPKGGWLMLVIITQNPLKNKLHKWCQDNYTYEEICTVAAQAFTNIVDAYFPDCIAYIF
jgi:hypothetical protein